MEPDPSNGNPMRLCPIACVGSGWTSQNHLLSSLSQGMMKGCAAPG